MGSKLKAQILTAISPGKPFSFSSLVGIFKSLLFRSYYASDFENTVAARCKSGKITIDEALEYFHTLLRNKPRPSIRSFNHLLGAVSKMNHDSTVVSMFRAMLGGEEFCPEVGTLNIVIRSLCRSKRADLGFSVFALGIKTGVSHNERTTNTLLHGLCASGSISKAAEFFRRISVNDVTYATMINGFCRSGDTAAAMEMIESMCHDERVFFCPTVSCFSPVINRLCKERRIGEALRVFRDMIARGVLPNGVCFNSLIDGLGKSGGRSEEAAALVSEMAGRGISPDVRSYNSLIDLLCKEGKTEEAMKLAELMALEGVKPDVVTFNSLLSALCKRGRWDEVLQVLRSMRLFGVEPDIVTFNTVLNARCKEGSTEVALHLVEAITKKNGGGLHDPETYNSLLCGLCHLGRLEDAHRLFDAMVGGKIFPDIWTLNIVLDALCNEGMMEKAQWLFDTMMEHHKEVNHVTYNTLIKGYSRQGQMDKARDVFVRMALKGVFPDIISYNTLVKGYVKIKKTNVALKLLKEMVTSGLLPNHVSRNIFRSIVAYRLGPYFQHFEMR